MQRYAAVAYSDQVALLDMVGRSADLASKTLKHVASLGASGKHPDNTKGQLVKLLGVSSMPDPYFFEVSLRIPNSVTADGTKAV